jgi:putative addiction module antidote
MIRKFDARLRKVGNSYVITIPKDSVERFELGEGDLLAISFDSDEIKKDTSQEKEKRK